MANQQKTRTHTIVEVEENQPTPINDLRTYESVNLSGHQPQQDAESYRKRETTFLDDERLKNLNDLLRQYEFRCDTESDPKALKRYENEIATIKRQIDGLTNRTLVPVQNPPKFETDLSTNTSNTSRRIFSISFVIGSIAILGLGYITFQSSCETQNKVRSNVSSTLNKRPNNGLYYGNSSSDFSSNSNFSSNMFSYGSNIANTNKQIDKKMLPSCYESGEIFSQTNPYPKGCRNIIIGTSISKAEELTKNIDSNSYTKYEKGFYLPMFKVSRLDIEYGNGIFSKVSYFYNKDNRKILSIEYFVKNDNDFEKVINSAKNVFQYCTAYSGHYVCYINETKMMLDYGLKKIQIERANIEKNSTKTNASNVNTNSSNTNTNKSN